MSGKYVPGMPFGIAQRFRGFLPVVVDVETSGLDCRRHGLLEMAAIMIEVDSDGLLTPGDSVFTHVLPHEGAELDPASLRINGIDPFHPLRAARTEADALRFFFKPIQQAVKASGCQRAILVGHNSSFDLGFINAAIARCGSKSPFHEFSSFDTATLAGMVFGQTVLTKAIHAAGIEWNGNEAHSAVYDTRKTAELFCHMVNRWERLHRQQAMS